MSLKSLLMPTVTGYLFSKNRLLARRAKREKARKLQGRHHEVWVFLQADDPYSYLLLQALPAFLGRYSVNLRFHLVSKPTKEAMPEPEKAVAYALVDARRLARHYGLEFEATQMPSVNQVQIAERGLAHCLTLADPFELCDKALKILSWLWSPSVSHDSHHFAQANPEEALASVVTGEGVRKRLGHYSSGMLYYEGEWYWAIDRLYHLEERLRGLGVVRPPARGLMFPPFKLPPQAPGAPLEDGLEIDFYFSFRSPYSAIVAPRVFALAKTLGVKVNLRFVLPMVMRGLPVPAEKKRYIVFDTLREALSQGIDFGRINDPVGAPTERGLSLVPLAMKAGKGQAYVESFMKGVWAEGIDAGSDGGLKKIVDRAG
ncbi:MAG: DsbA family protein, partial [Limnobacter sp.]|nr:DsbA family protein [Limnobacter sp.]